MRAFVVALFAVVGLAATAPGVGHWKPYTGVKTPIDLTGPLANGDFVLAANGRLGLLPRSGSIRSFPGQYFGPGGEPYIAISPGGCFGKGAVYALRLTKPGGVTVIAANGQTHNLANLVPHALLNGIAFDTTGRFGHRLLVTDGNGAGTLVHAIDCHGALTTITAKAPRGEGGIAVAPAGFGRFAGDLIVPDEIGGRVYAITPAGRSLLVFASRHPHGQDTGVESEGFVPTGAAKNAFVADRLTPGNHHPGDDLILRLPLTGLKPGELLVSSEGGGLTDVVSCSAHRCNVRFLAQGPAIAHVEGHIVFR